MPMGIQCITSNWAPAYAGATIHPRPGHFTPRFLHFACGPWKRASDPSRLGNRPCPPGLPMPIESLAPHLSTVVMFLGVLLFSVVAAVIAILADY